MADKAKSTSSKKIPRIDAKAELARLEEIAEVNKKIDNLNRHIDNVKDAARLLGKRLIESGEISFGKQLISNSMLHDLSKFSGIEWECLAKADPRTDSEGENLRMAIHQHVMTNDHHPEKWGGVDEMPKLAIAELVCDLKARSSEFATDLRRYVKEVFAIYHNMSLRGKGYKIMKMYMDILLDAPLKKENPLT